MGCGTGESCNRRGNGVESIPPASTSETRARKATLNRRATRERKNQVTDIREMMTDEQKARLTDPPAWENAKRPMGWPLGATPFQMTGHFHTVMGLPTPDDPIIPSVSMRERRLRLILEELQELIDANGFYLECEDHIDGVVVMVNLKNVLVQHIEGSRYDLVETADALGDLNVVVNGTGVEYGIPMHFVDYEIYCSNLSKLDPQTGKPIVNHCTKCGPDSENIYASSCECDDETLWLKPGVPIGKILKSDSFVPTNIPRVLLAYQEREI